MLHRGRILIFALIINLKTYKQYDYKQYGKPYVVGMDIGGTNTVFGIVDSRGNVLSSDSVKTQQYDVIDEYVDAVCKKLLPLIQAVGGADKIKGMGVGAPNGNYYNGTIEFAPNLPWKGIIPLAAMFEEKLGIPTALTNDANAAAIGEMTYGAARGMKDFIMITLGTGVGSGIVINGQLVYGHDGFAGELGHVIVDPVGRPCGCGRRGCLETYCSATGVARTAREFLVQRTEPSLLRNIPADDIVSKDVYDAAVKGDKLALDILNLPVVYWEKLWLTLLPSQVRKLLSYSVAWQNRVIIS